ncbi:MAG: molecular chaperone SurA [Gammaproteobacteria bacterium]|nr:molecular chaperone SurA [Gammaproteobacteria bacterium]
MKTTYSDTPEPNKPMTKPPIRNNLILLLLLVVIGGISGNAVAAKIQSVDRIVAIVDDEVIVQSTLNEKMAQVVAQLRAKKAKLPPKNILERQVLERLIIDRIQLTAAATAGINVSEEVLAQAVSNIARSNNMSLSEFRKAVKNSGLSFSKFRKQIRKQITTKRYRNKEMRSRIHITEREIDTYIAKGAHTLGKRSAFHLFHILVATPESSSADKIQAAKHKAQKLVKKLRAGGDFQNLALSQSDGQQALEGGDLGWRSANQIPSAFANTILKMGRGDITNPIRTSSGFHIIKLADYKGSGKAANLVAQTKARHILVHTSEITSDDDARIRLEQLKQRLDGGEDFAALARSHSDDQASSIKGGELGWINPGDVVPDFEQQIQSLAANEISKPFRTQYGWHIVQVMGRRQHDMTSNIQRSQAREAIHKRKAVEETALLMRRLRDEAYVEIRLNEL